MSTAEKSGLVLIIVFVAAIGYFLIDIMKSDRLEDPPESSAPGPAEEEIEPVVESRILEDMDPQPPVEKNRIREEVEPLREAVTGPRSGVAFGRVVDESGRPIEGAAVTLYEGTASMLTRLPQPDRVQAEGATDEKGCYELFGIESGDQYMVMAAHPEYAETTLSPLKIMAGARIEIADIILGHGLQVKGTVKDTMGNPIVGGVVVLRDPIRAAFLEDEERKPWKQVVTDPFGAYGFENVPFQSFEVLATAEGYATHRKSNHAQFENRKENVIDFVLAPATFISGRVSDEAGVPIAGAKAEATQVRTKEYVSTGVAWSGRDGSFFIESLVEGTYVVRGSKKDYSIGVERNVRSGIRDLMVTLQPRGRIAGFVLDEATNRPVTQFTIRAFKAQPGRPLSPTRIMETFSSKEGAYHLTDLEPGVYRFTCSAEGYADRTSDEVAVVRDHGINNVDIYLNRGGSLSGLVVDPSGQPLEGIKVTLNDNNFQENPLTQLFTAMAGPEQARKKKSTVTGEDGTFRLTLIVPGTYQVTFAQESYCTKAINDVQVFLGEDATPPMGKVVMTRGAGLFGTVRDAAGGVMPGEAVVLTQANDNAFMMQTSTDKQGQYAFQHIQPGEYTITVQFTRINGREMGNILKRLSIAQRSRITVYLEEGREEQVDIRMVE